MPKSVSWLLLGLATLVAAGGFIQVLDGNVFWCGRWQAFPGTTVLAVVCLVQVGLCLAAAASDGWETAYRLSQCAVLPFLIAGLCQIFLPYPRTALFFAILAAVPTALCPLSRNWRWMRPHLPTLTALFIVSSLGFLAGFGEIPFTLPNVVVPPWLIVLSAAAAAIVSISVIGSVHHVLPPAASLSSHHLSSHHLSRHLPFALLLFPILRGKLPDVAYDSLMYKTTMPYQLAEWLTGDTAIPDGYMIGTNLQEMLNTLLVVITRDYLPPFISTISFVLLAFITPLAFPCRRTATPVAKIVVTFAGLSAFVLTEAGIAQGTAYQEPLLLLFMVAALIRCPAWPAFLAMAVAVKINAAFIAPLVVLYHVLDYRTFWVSPRRLLTGLLTGSLILAPQLDRNILFSGRLLGMSETLAAVTDPPGPHQVMSTGATRYDARVRGGIVNNAVQSACNMWLLDGLCSTGAADPNEVGFNFFPASRAPLFAILFATALLLGRRWRGVASVGVFAVCYTGFLSFLSEDRYFLPLSFGFSVLLLINHEQAEDMVQTVLPWRRMATALGCWLIGTNLVPGTFTNVSWICKRELLTTADLADLRQPVAPVQRFLASYVARYKQICPPPGLPPVILAENDKLNSPYLGTERIFHVFTQPMITRFFTANPARQAQAADGILAVVSETADYASRVLGPARGDFTPCFGDGSLQVVCSVRLAPAGPQCATSLYLR